MIFGRCVKFETILNCSMDREIQQTVAAIIFDATSSHETVRPCLEPKMGMKMRVVYRIEVINRIIYKLIFRCDH